MQSRVTMQGQYRGQNECVAMSFRKAAIPVVTICDTRGVLVWTNHPNPHYRAGTPVWDYAAEADRELVKDRISRVAFMNEPQEFEVSTDDEQAYHVWAWPMGTENLSVCLVGMRLPKELSRLTARELACLRQLATGCNTLQIAAEFDVSASTVHTYMRRAREKLELSSIENLIAFAARHLSPSEPLELVPSQPQSRREVEDAAASVAGAGI